MRALHVCIEQGCPELIPQGKTRCQDHERERNRRLKRDRAVAPSRYLTPEWRLLRQVVLERDQYRCRECGEPATDVDHIVPVIDGGEDEVSNLMSLCHRCHSRKTMREVRDSGRLADGSAPAPRGTTPQRERSSSRRVAEMKKEVLRLIAEGIDDHEIRSRVGPERLAEVTLAGWRREAEA